MITNKKCAVCGESEFLVDRVLWPELINEWELKPEEVDYIDQQQGAYCTSCYSNFRSIALANAILNAYQFSGTFIEFIASRAAQKLIVLEINEAGSLSPLLSKLPHHKIAQYPEFDMMKLSFEAETFDLGFHSDPLEHVPNPLVGLKECFRVIKPGGRCIYTVPLIVGRLSRFRIGFSPSYHGEKHEKGDDYIVHTEFGADAWIYPLQAGFGSVNTHAYQFPSALALESVRA